MRRRGAGGDLGGDLRAGADAGVAEALRGQPVERRRVEREPRRLEDRGLVPAQPQPAQILDDSGDMLGPAAAGIDILDAQQVAPALRPDEVMRAHRREGVAEVETPGRARRETGNYTFSHRDS